MSTGITLRPRNESRSNHHGARAPIGRVLRMAALLGAVSILASNMGCAAEEGDEAELADSEQSLRIASDDADIFEPVVTKPRSTTTNQTTTTGTVVQTGGGVVVGGGVHVVAFTKNPDGSYHCKGDADCNKMFSSGVCKGGILDSSCDTTSTVECWCY